MNAHFWFDVFQLCVVGVLVAGCLLYCLLTLAPNFIQQPLKKALLRCPLPGFVRARLQQTATGGCGSNCGGCAPNPGKPQPVKWHSRAP